MVFRTPPQTIFIIFLALSTVLHDSTKAFALYTYISSCALFLNQPQKISLFHKSKSDILRRRKVVKSYVCKTMEAPQMVEQRRRIDSNKIGHVGFDSTTNNRRIIRKKRCRLTRRRKQQPPPPSISSLLEETVPEQVTLQKLFVSCQEVFKGPGTIPRPSDVHRLRCVIDRMKPEDVGLSSDLQFFKSNGTARANPRVTYTTIYKCNNFSLCLFFLPATAVIPLHNHPEMTVFSKLLLGTMHIKSYDWVDPVKSDGSVPRPASQSSVRLARLKANSVFTAPCDTSVLYPTSGGNIHQFTAIKPCAVLDVIGPPYSEEDGRDCTYYKDIPYSPFSNGDWALGNDDDRYGWLEEIEMPEDSQMDGIEYMGPQIIDTS